MRSYTTRVSIFILLFCMTILFVPRFSDKLISIKNNFTIVSNAASLNYTNTIQHDDDIYMLKNVIQKNIGLGKENEKNIYLYVDHPDEQGTMNYYKLRYYLVPAKLVKYGYYGYSVPSDNLFKDLIVNFNVDYVIVRRNNEFLGLINQELIGRENVILKVLNRQAASLSDMLQEVK